MERFLSVCNICINNNNICKYFIRSKKMEGKKFNVSKINNFEAFALFQDKNLTLIKML